MNAGNKPKIGLVLGGGGARGLAHIGVLKVFARRNIPVDLLAGASMGGFMAAAYATGLSILELDAEAMRMTRLTRMIRLVDLSGPRRGLIEGSRLRAYLCSLLGKDTRIENLPIPLALLAVDLLTGRLIVLREGRLVDAVQATMAVPGLFTPVRLGEYRLVDGGLLDNVPIDVARNMGADITIAVDVSPSYIQDASPGSQPGEKDWPAWFPSFARDFYLAELLMISTLTEIRLREARPDIIIRPCLPAGISIFWGFNRAAEAIKAGELAALQIMPDLEEILKA
jgi:predicted acylesterase/phospholipase RssA